MIKKKRIAKYGTAAPFKECNEKLWADCEPSDIVGMMVDGVELVVEDFGAGICNPVTVRLHGQRMGQRAVVAIRPAMMVPTNSAPNFSRMRESFGYADEAAQDEAATDSPY